MRRREFIALLGGAAVWPIAARAEQPTMPVIGVLRINPPEFDFFAEVFRRDMSKLGWDEGRNIRFHFVWARGRNEDVPALAKVLVGRNVDLIVTFGNLGVLSAQRATATIPIVGMSDDMVREGLAASMARPGGHTTGVSILGAELDLKRLELLSEYVPHARRVAVLTDTASATPNQDQIAMAARRLNLELANFTVRNADGVTLALDQIAAADVGAVNVLASPMLNGMRRLIFARLRDTRLPSIHQWPESADDGCLIGYGAPVASLYGRVAVLVDRILRGARPADLPIEQPTSFELVVNLHTARAIGLSIPPSLLSRADRVIE
jgi:putative ABC transport system substrate-binding protein